MRFREAPPPRRRISLTPLIDVVFLLLVFFMMSSSFIQWRQVDLHAGTKETSSGLHNKGNAHWIAVRVRSCAEGGISVDTQQVSPNDLSNVVRDIAKPDSKVRLSAADTVSVACMVRVLDGLEAAQISATTVEGLSP